MLFLKWLLVLLVYCFFSAVLHTLQSRLRFITATEGTNWMARCPLHNGDGIWDSFWKYLKIFCCRWSFWCFFLLFLEFTGRRQLHVVCNNTGCIVWQVNLTEDSECSCHTWHMLSELHQQIRPWYGLPKKLWKKVLTVVKSMQYLTRKNCSRSSSDRPH